MDRTESEESQQNTSPCISLQYAITLILKGFVFQYPYMMKNNNDVKIPIFSYKQI